MRLNCHGYVTNWSARALIQGTLTFIPYLIRFQVWRPLNEQSYSLVGSNELRFSGTALRNGFIPIPGEQNGFFSFNHRVDREEQIHFIPGDVVGWFVPMQSALERPLNVLCVRATDLPAGRDTYNVTLYALDVGRELCTVCGIEKSGGAGETVRNIIPLVAPVVGEYVDTLLVKVIVQDTTTTCFSHAHSTHEMPAHSTHEITCLIYNKGLSLMG
jgi:hypothetical protein